VVLRHRRRRPDRTDGDTVAVGARARATSSCAGWVAAASANGWDSETCAHYRALPKLAELGERSADKSLTRDELIELSRPCRPTGSVSSAVGDAATAAPTQYRAAAPTSSSSTAAPPSISAD
jgi:hypothetical protein